MDVLVDFNLMLLISVCSCTLSRIESCLVFTLRTKGLWIEMTLFTPFAATTSRKRVESET